MTAGGSRPVLLALALALALFLLTSTHAGAEPGGEVPPGWVAYDGGGELIPVASPGGFVTPFAIAFFSDCTGTSRDPRSCGPPPVRWATGTPVSFCTVQADRPALLTAEAYRALVARSAETWNAQEAAIGVRYVGDCGSGSTWQFEDGTNQIGWDDVRQAVVGSEAGVTRGTWFLLPGNVKEFLETDIIFDGTDFARLAPVCLESIVAHELGHALGLGHSDVRTDLMFPAFDPNDLTTCKIEPTAAERSRLQSLYGVDRAPILDIGLERVVDPGATVVLAAAATDPEGGPLTYEWAQTAGPGVQLASTGASTSFTAPGQVPSELTFEVKAFDRFLHSATSAVTVTVTPSVAPPASGPSLESFLGVAGGTHARLTWTEVAGAATYQLCSRRAGSTAAFGCQTVGSPAVEVNWDTVLGSTGKATDRRVFDFGAREVELRACNSKGCSPAGTGGLSGGVRWARWNVDFDYFALAFDTATVQFTIVGVVNVSGAPRAFTLNTGPAEEPDRVRIQSCGTLGPGSACLGFLGPGDRHFEVVDVISRAGGAPSTEHRIKVR